MVEWSRELDLGSRGPLYEPKLIHFLLAIGIVRFMRMNIAAEWQI